MVHDMKGSFHKGKKKAGADGSLLVCSLVRELKERWYMNTMKLKEAIQSSSSSKMHMIESLKPH